MNVIEENMKQPVSNKTKSKEVETKNGESISTVQNLLQYMVYLLVEEQSKSGYFYINFFSTLMNVMNL